MVNARVFMGLVAAFVLIAITWFAIQHQTPAPDSQVSIAPQSERPQFELPEAETAWLWELEHRSNILGTYGFANLKAVLADNSPQALSELLAKDFQGSVFERPQSIAFESTDVSAERLQQTGSFVPLQANQFVEQLLQLRSQMDTMSRCSIGVKRIGPLDRQQTDGRWTSLCEMWLRGTTGEHRVEVTVLFQLDTNQPDKERMSGDGWILGCSLLETAVSKTQGILFDDVTESTGVDAAALHDNWTSSEKINNPGGVYACDFNRDGRTDFLVTDVNPVGNSLFKGIGDGKFKDVTNPIGLGKIRQVSLAVGNAAFVDLNNDGWVDLLHTAGAIWENDQGKQFVDRSTESNLFQITDAETIELKSVSIADYDRDGLLDLYVLRRNEMPMSWLADKGQGPGSVLCRNLGNWQFADVTTESGTDGDNSLIFTTVWFDANNDNWPDLAIINEFGDSFLYINQQNGRFEQHDVDPNKSDFGSMGVDVGDIDNDGLIDMYVAGMYSKAGSRIIGNLANDAFPDHVMQRLASLIDGSELYRNKGDLAFSAHGQQDRVHNIGWSWGPTLADFNNDGWLDIYAPSGYMSRDRRKPDG